MTSPATRLILVRHGQSEGNVAAETALRDGLERIDVPARDPDVELSETGRQQAAAVGHWLSDLGDSSWVPHLRRSPQLHPRPMHQSHPV